MKRKSYTWLLTSISFIISLLLLVLANPKVIATVGGPTYVSQISYDAQNKAIYFLRNDFGGMGCPPIINRIDLETKAKTEVQTCAEVFSDINDDYDVKITKHKQFVKDFFAGFQSLSSINLRKNKISAAIKVVAESKKDDYPEWTDFEMEIKQNNIKKADISFRGCAADQPNIVEGYMVPNSNIMVLLLSHTGDCFESGYIEEDTYIVEGITYYDKNIVRPQKLETATDVNAGNMVVYTTTSSYSWYSTQTKPSWAPPSWLFSPVWTVLYALIAITFGTVFYKAITRKIPWVVALPFVLNLIFNFAFTPLQFGLQNNLLAAIDIILVWTTLAWALVVAWKHFRWIVYTNIPYFLWVSFATILQLTVTYLNW